MGLREHEKFWAFIVLILSIVLMALIARFTPGTEIASALRDAIIGLIGIAGAAGQSLFRSNTERELSKALSSSNNGEAKPVKIEQPANQPVPVQEKPAQPSAELDPIFMRNE